LKPATLRYLFNLYPPYLFTGIKVARIAPDYRYVRVEMPLRFYNRNYVGTHFGGNLFAMADPFYMLMVMHNLGDDYIVWDKAGAIEYRKPGRGRVVAEFRIDQDLIDRIRAATAESRKFEPILEVDIIDPRDGIIAHVTRTLHIRVKSSWLLR